MPLMTKASQVVVIPGFKGVFRESKIGHCLVTARGRHGCLVNNAGLKAVSLQRALVWFAAIAKPVRFSWIWLSSFGENAVVMCLYNGCYVRQAAVAHLYCVAVKDLMQLRSLWKMFHDRLQELLANAGLDVPAVWRVEPQYFPGSLPPTKPIGTLFSVLKELYPLIISARL